MARGGKRIGAGRRKSFDPTVTIRVPGSKKEQISLWLKNDVADGLDGKNKKTVDEAITMLNAALSMKANAGGRIKTQVREVILLLERIAG